MEQLMQSVKSISQRMEQAMMNANRFHKHYNIESHNVVIEG